MNNVALCLDKSVIICIWQVTILKEIIFGSGAFNLPIFIYHLKQ